MKDEKGKIGTEKDFRGNESVDVEENGDGGGFEEKAFAEMIKWSLQEKCPEVPDREGLLEEVFESHKSIVLDYDEEETNSAGLLGDSCDSMICGQGAAPTTGRGEQDELLSVCRMIHSSFAESSLGEVRRRVLLKPLFDAYADRKNRREECEADVPSGSSIPSGSSVRSAVEEGGRTGRKSFHNRAWAVGAVALAAGFAALLWTWNVRRFDDPARAGDVLEERIETPRLRVARMIPGPFPSDQTSTDRIDLLYSERLSTYRHGLVGKFGGKRVAPAAVAALEFSGGSSIPATGAGSVAILWKR